MDGERLGDMSSRNDQTVNHWMPYWVKNLMENYATISRQAKAHTQDLWQGTSTYNNVTINSLPRYPLTPGLVMGSGPSLDDALPFIKDFPGKIVCGSSQLKACVASGREPDYLICLDSNKSILPDVKFRKEGWPNTTLITHPSIDPSILRYWKWNVKYFRPLQLQDPFFDKYYPMLYPFIEIALLNAGCTINCELEVANFIGLSPIVLSGVDFGFPDNRPRHSRFELKDGEWEKLDDPPIQAKYSIRVSKNGVPTTEEMITYKQNLFLVARTDLTQLYTSSRGIITPEETLGFIAPDQYKNLGKTWPEWKDPDEIEKHYDKVLLGMGIKLVEDKGNLRVTAVDESKAKKAVLIVGKGKTYSTTVKEEKGKEKKKVKVAVPMGFEKNA